MKNFKGLFKDTTYEKNPEATWQHAKNILLGEKFNTPVNENGTAPFHSVEGTVIGVIETNLHIVYFSKLSTISTAYNSIITLYDRNKDTLEEVLIGDFNFDRPIEGIYKYDFQGNLVVVWWDGVFDNSNPPRIAKLTNIDLPLVDNILPNSKFELINLFPNINNGEIELRPIDGSVEGVYAYVTFKYVYKDNETVFKNVNTGISLNESLIDNDDLISKGFEINFTNLDYQTYDSIIIGLYIVGEEEDTAYVSPKIAIEDTILNYKVQSLSNFTVNDAQEIIVPTDHFNKIETGTESADSLVLGNVEKADTFKFQKYANMLTLLPVNLASAASNRVINLNIDQCLLYGEVYAIYIQLDLKNGETTDWFHIPNRNFNANETEDFWSTELRNKYELELNNFEESLDLKRFHFENTGSTVKFGFWQNEEKYPNDDEYDSTVDYDGSSLGGENLKGKNVTHHRIMNEPEGENFSGTRVPIVGASILGWEGIPGNVRAQITGVRLGFAKRDLGNSLIISNGTLLPAWSPQTRKLESDASLPYDKIATSLQGDIFQVASNMGYRTFNRAQYISAETELYKPKLDFNMVMVNYIAQNRVLSGGTTELNENVHDSIYPGFEIGLDKNRYWWGYKSYDYKLPNNSATGSEYLDGGLFINFVEDRQNLNYYGELDFDQFTEGFIGSTLKFSVADFLRPAALEPKMLFLEHNNSAYYYAGVSLMNIRETLYSLNSKNIVSSTNTIKESDISSISQFFLGDVQLSTVNLNYKLPKLVWSAGSPPGSSVPTEDTELKVAPLQAKSYSPLLSSKVISVSTYPKILFEGLTGDLEILNGLNYGLEVNVTAKYAQYNDLAGFNAFNHKDNTLTKFPYRIIRSAAIPDETFIINAMRTFFVDAYYEMVRNKGDIVAIRGNDRELYIQMRFELFYAISRDVITSDTGDTYLTRRDIFDRPPSALSIKREGFIGCEHKFACVMTRWGYVTVDHQQGNIIMANPEVKLLNDIGVRSFMRNLLEFSNEYREDVSNVSKAIDNPFDYIGFAIGIDESYNRLFITKLLPPVLQQNVDTSEREFYQEQLEGQSMLVDLDFPVYKPNSNSFTLSFALDAGFWLCEHSFVPNIYWNFKKRLYGLSNHVFNPVDVRGYVHEFNKGLKGVYFGNREESYIDIIFNEGEGSRSLFSIELDTIRERSPDDTREVIERTIDAIVVFNENQCSGEIDLPLGDYDKIRNAEGFYRINNFRDIIRSRNLPILDDRGVIDESNLDFNKNWFDKSYFIGTFTVVRLIWKNLNQDSIYVNEVKALSKRSER